MEEIIKELNNSLRELKNRKYKAKNYNQGVYWQNQIDQVEKLIKQYENKSDSSTISDIVDSGIINDSGNS